MTSRIEPISITHPELVEEWDYDKNGDLLPEQITCSSSIKIHWKCKHGHEWIATPRSRTSVVHTGCPHCEHRVATPGEYLLLTEYPELAAEWDYDKNPENVAPDNILPNDRNKYWWKCSNGHSFENSPHGRISRHVAPDYVKCPYCSHHIVSPGEYSFATEYPELLNEWDWDKNAQIGLDPDNILPASGKDAHWKCDMGHTWVTTPAQRAQAPNCPYCEHWIATPGEYSILTEFPELALEWDYKKNPPDITPDDILPGTHKKYWWKCKNGHSFERSPYARTRSCTPPEYVCCPHCSHNITTPGEYSLATEYPDLLKEWDYEKNTQLGLDPDYLLPGSNKKAHWKCEHGHEWEAVINSRSKQGTGCPYCSHKLASSGKYSLLTVYPELSSEWDYEKNPPDLTPDDVVPGSYKKVWWKCKNGHSFEQSVHNRTRRRVVPEFIPCPHCSHKVATPGEYSLSTEYPNLLAEWNWDRNSDLGLIPDELLPTSNKNAWWKCLDCGHDWEATIGARTKGGQCPICSGKKKPFLACIV